MRAILHADMRDDALIDRFVAHVNASGLCEEPIRRSDAIDWLPAFEERLPRRLPPTFRSLVGRYVFPSFPVGGVQLSGNTGEDLDDELVRQPFRDRDVSTGLLARGYVQLGRPDTGSFDPVCFATGEKARNREHRIVIVDHEDVLLYARIRIVEEIAPSFRRFVERILAGAS
jgi:hypothetical protein